MVSSGTATAPCEAARCASTRSMNRPVFTGGWASVSAAAHGRMRAIASGCMPRSRNAASPFVQVVVEVVGKLCPSGNRIAAANRSIASCPGTSSSATVSTWRSACSSTGGKFSTTRVFGMQRTQQPVLTTVRGQPNKTAGRCTVDHPNRMRYKRSGPFATTANADWIRNSWLSTYDMVIVSAGHGVEIW